MADAWCLCGGYMGQRFELTGQLPRSLIAGAKAAICMKPLFWRFWVCYRYKRRLLRIQVFWFV